MHVLESRAEKKKSFSFPISSLNKLLYGLEVSFFIRAFPLEKRLLHDSDVCFCALSLSGLHSLDVWQGWCTARLS